MPKAMDVSSQSNSRGGKGRHILLNDIHNASSHPFLSMGKEGNIGQKYNFDWWSWFKNLIKVWISFVGILVCALQASPNKQLAVDVNTAHKGKSRDPGSLEHYVIFQSFHGTSKPKNNRWNSWLIHRRPAIDERPNMPDAEK